MIVRYLFSAALLQTTLLLLSRNHRTHFQIPLLFILYIKFRYHIIYKAIVWEAKRSSRIFEHGELGGEGGRRYHGGWTHKRYINYKLCFHGNFLHFFEFCKIIWFDFFFFFLVVGQGLDFDLFHSILLNPYSLWLVSQWFIIQFQLVKGLAFLKIKNFPFHFVWLLRKLLKKNPFFMAFWHLLVERINGIFNIGDQSNICLLNCLVGLFCFCCFCCRYQIWPRFFWLDFMRSANSHYMCLQYPMSWKYLWGE